MFYSMGAKVRCVNTIKHWIHPNVKNARITPQHCHHSLRRSGLCRRRLSRSDNGGAKKNHADNTPLRDYKHSVYEGGLRVPFIVSWPGHLAANSKCDEPIISIDILPTICAAVGIDLPQDGIYDGQNMLPALKGESSSPLHDNLFFDGDDGYWSVRAGDWKLVLNPQEKLELYNLHDDVGETNDLSQKYPQKVQELNATYQSWRHEMAPRIHRAN